MVSNRDIKLGKMSPSPRPFPLPLLGARIGRPQYTKERNQEVLIQRVAHEPNVLVPHQTQEPNRVDPVQAATFGDPSPRIDRDHVLSLVPQAVPGVPVERARLVVHGFPGFRVADPSAVEEVAGSGDLLFGRGRGRRRGGRGSEESGGEEEDDYG